MSLSELENRYARLLGLHQSAETQAEDAIGLKAIIAADSEIRRSRRQLEGRMAQIRKNIRALHNPDWEPYHLWPIQPKPQEKYHLVARRAYAVLRSHGGWMKVQPLAQQIVAEMGLEVEHRLVSKFANTIRGGLTARVTEGLIEKRGNPAEYRIKPTRWLKPPGASANILPSPWRPSSSTPAAPAEASDDHCPSPENRPATKARQRSSGRGSS